MSNRILAILVLIAALAFAASPAVFDSFGGYTPEQFPNPQDDPPVQPAGWAFAIWGLIYAWLIAGAAYGLWRAADDPDWRSMRPPLLVSLGMGFVWIPVANRSPIWATVLIVAMLLFAAIAFLRAGRRDRVWQCRPVALYAGWLTAASGASLGIVLAGHGVLSEGWAAILSLLVVSAVASAVQTMRPDEWAYPAGVVWALLAIVVANLSPLNFMVLLIAAVAAALLTWRGFRNLSSG